MKKALRIAGWISVGAISALLLFYLCAYCYDIPLIGEDSRVRIYDNQGVLLYESNFNKSGTWVSYQEIPQVVLDAVVSVEDRRFYYHPGFDPLRIIKALWVNFTAGEVVEGGSTITQQYARNVFLNLDQTLVRKVKELFLSAALETHYNKEQILEGYLNTIYFGHGIYGINDASAYFFEKELSELSLAEAALLVGVPNGPALYSPYISYDNAQERQATVLRSMLRDHKITDEEYEKAKQSVIVLGDKKSKEDHTIAGYYIDLVLQKAKDLGLWSEQYLSHGLNIYTSYDADIQKTLHASIEENMEAEDKMQIAGVVLEPFSGKVLAVAGGRDYTASQYNRIYYSQRQIGSTLKPLLYYLALTDGFTPSTEFLSQPTSFMLEDGSLYTPSNFSDIYPNKEISMIHALSVSDNIYAVKTHLFLGVQALQEALASFGIEEEATAAMALGATEFPLIDLAKIYNTFASEGLYYEPTLILAVTDSEDTLLYEAPLSYTQLLERNECLMVSQLLRAPFDIRNTTRSSPSLLGYEPFTKVAAKSGSSDWDSVLAAYNPQYTLVLWGGYDENQPLTSYEQRKKPRVIFKDFFNRLYPRESPGPWYEMSKELKEVRVEPVSGTLNANGSLYWYQKDSIIE